MPGGLAYSSRVGRWVLAATVLGSAIAALDATVVGIALPAIGRTSTSVRPAWTGWLTPNLSWPGCCCSAGPWATGTGGARSPSSARSGSRWPPCRAGWPPTRRRSSWPGPCRGSGPPCSPRAACPSCRRCSCPTTGPRPSGPVRAGRPGHRDRPVRGRLADQRGVLAAGVLHQPAGGRGGGGDHGPARAGFRAPEETGRLDTPVRSRSPGRCRHHLRAYRRARRRLDVGHRAGLAAGRAGPAGRLPLHRIARQGPDVAAQRVRVAAVLRGERGDVRGRRRAGRDLVPAADVLQEAAGDSPLASGAALLPVTAITPALSARFGALAARIGPGCR